MANYEASLWAARVSALVANRAVIRLHAMLLGKGFIDSDEVELLRHLHLHDFDQSLDESTFEDARSSLEDDRKVMDEMWQSAIQVPRPEDQD